MAAVGLRSRRQDRHPGLAQPELVRRANPSSAAFALRGLPGRSSRPEPPFLAEPRAEAPDKIRFSVNVTTPGSTGLSRRLKRNADIQPPTILHSHGGRSDFVCACADRTFTRSRRSTPSGPLLRPAFLGKHRDQRCGGHVNCLSHISNAPPTRVRAQSIDVREPMIYFELFMTLCHGRLSGSTSQETLLENHEACPAVRRPSRNGAGVDGVEVFSQLARVSSGSSA